MTDKIVELIRRFTPMSSRSAEWDFLMPGTGKPQRWHEIEDAFRVLVIADPGAIHTPLIDKVLGAAENRDEIYATWVATHPIGRLGQPAEVASLAVYLGSDESAFATGAEFRLDGGATL